MNKYLLLLKKCSPALISLFSSMYTMVQVFPYLPWMVQHLIPGLEAKDIGYYSGLIASTQFIGRAVGSYSWGWLADRFGRKIVLIVSGLCLAFAVAGFGFSESVVMAVIFRFLVGIFNGIVPTAKAVISELSDDTTQPFAMGFLGASFSLGLVFGSGFSGLLADPITQYGIPSFWLFARFPYVLPGLVNALVLLVGVGWVYFFMEETLNMNQKPREASKTPLSENVEAASSEEEQSEEDVMLRDGRVVSTNRWKRFLDLIQTSVLYRLLTDWVVILVLMLYSAFSVVALSFDEVLPLWVKVPHELGGLSMSIRSFSLIISISAVFAFPLILFIFQFLERRLGGLRSFHIMIILLIPVTILYPAIAALPHYIAVYISLGIFNILMRSLFSGVFAALSMFTNNSVTEDMLGAVNGLSLSICSIFRSLAPIYGGTVFAASLNVHTFPLDFHLIFVLNAILLIFCIVLAMPLPKSINHKKTRQAT